MKPYPHIVVQLGRIGDILNIAPACVALGLRHIMVHEQFTSMFQRLPYLSPIPICGNMENLAGAVDHACELAENVLVPQLFGLRQPIGLSLRTRPHFAADQWDRLQPGLGDNWGTLPLVVVGAVPFILPIRVDKPLLLVNTVGLSGPYPHAAALRESLCRWDKQFTLLDAGAIRLPCFCDLVTLYEKAAGLITIDTATLHLARACPRLPVFQFVRNGRDGMPPIYPNHQGYNIEGFSAVDAFLEKLL